MNGSEVTLAVGLITMAGVAANYVLLSFRVNTLEIKQKEQEAEIVDHAVRLRAMEELCKERHG